ncbi:PREDICTED: olfactory receptor 6C2-like [Condylura cristata]|uniref:olfactory receptor 6C2-like n=1 Tax=Condylura cristata TaxID=143302 RepID=UPI0003343E3E|nr:PREDICTED: olfactory receptor 6C2-like [Condylura cristata]
MRNHTAITTFILLGLTDDPYLKILVFIFLFTSYMLSIAGNLIIILLTLVDSHLKTAMYYFLQNFSILEISFTSACVPRYLYSLSTGNRTITYSACLSQLFLIDLFAVTGFFLLTVMSYDRYVAICKPLHYVTIMNRRFCKTLVIGCWVTTFFLIFPLFILFLCLEFCDSNAIDHFLCDANPLMKISCSDTWFLEQLVVVCTVLIFIVTLVCVVLSYIYIIRTILRFPSAQQRQKAFSTCSSHMIVLSISYGSCIFIYIKPSAKDDVTMNKGIALLPVSISPMLNPFIYTLRNKQVVKAFNDLVTKLYFFQGIRRMLKGPK